MAGRGRCVTDIEVLDAMIGGGIPEGSLVIVAGGCGTGKSTLAYEFLLRGAIRGERGLLITTVESAEKYEANLPPFAFRDLAGDLVTVKEFKELDEGINIDSIGASDEAVCRFCERLEPMVTENGVRRLVIDSFSAITYGIEHETIIKDMLLRIEDCAFNHGCTVILVSDGRRFGNIEALVADGLVVMERLERNGDYLRTMQVIKMKGTEHTLSKYAIDISDQGLLATRLLKGGGE